MKRRTEHLVEKRDGRREFLRATKLARSVHLALLEIGVDEDWRALELASVVLEGLRQRRKSATTASASVTAVGNVVPGHVGPIVLTTAEIADSVQHLFVVTGQPTAAVAYGAVQAERARRRHSVATATATLAGADRGNRSSAPGMATPRQSSGSPQHGSSNDTASVNATDRFGGVWPGEG